MARGFSIARPEVSLTEVGKAYYDRCTQILSGSRTGRRICWRLAIDTARYASHLHGYPYRPVYRTGSRRIPASYPDAKVDLTMGERTIDLIDEGFDLAIRLALPPDSSLIVRSLATWRHVLCCSPAYLEKYGPPQQLSELVERNWVRHLFYPYGDDWHFVDRKGAPASVRVSGNLVTNSGETVRTAALQGVGISLAAGSLVAEDLEQGRLARLLPQYRLMEFLMNAVSPHRHHLSAKVRSFIDLLVHHSVEHQRPIDPFS